MSWKALPEWFLAQLSEVKARNKRAGVVIDHILEHGRVTTEELAGQYGYIHPPRARQDLKEHGIPVVSERVKSTTGKSIAAYTFGDPAEASALGERKAISKRFKEELVAASGSQCGICGGAFPSRLLQVDHRIPVIVGGDGVLEGVRRPEDYLLVCGSCNRAKSRSCEHCRNGLVDKRPETCRTCYWGSPKNYDHIALLDIRRLDIVWSGSEIDDYAGLAEAAAQAGEELHDFVKRRLRGCRDDRL